MTPQNSNYFLGKIFDPKAGALTADPLLLDPSNLTTHAVVTGMTGSGKTGLCIGMLEEAALHGTPAVIIDPKGDLTNLLLHFPSLLPSDFEPWIDPELARQQGESVPQLAQETADKWRKGLADWGMGPEQIQQLADSAEFQIYTPGSTSGMPVNIVSSFAAPDLPWEENSEVLRERITSTVTALLGLIGMTDIDPLRSREHILLSNLIETAWMNGKSLSLTDLILQVQNPPMQNLGAFPMDSFYPEKERFSLALLLNNFLASPSFQVWQQGQSLDIAQIFKTKSGKPRHAIFYIAHLSDTERMFFVTLLFAAVETWMRSQQGTSNLRALLYFDEIVGYLPPVANPPSKPIMMRMLKQARAFGLGLLLATQNPVDVDYKALSNAGTWLIGRLQTDQDKARLLDGLSSAGGNVDLPSIDKLISGLGKRVFLYHSVYKSAPALFGTRWTMNYLAGPLTRTQIPALLKLIGASNVAPAAAAGAPASSPTIGAAAVTPAPDAQTGVSTSRPAIPGAITEYFMSNNLGVSEAAAAANLPGTSQASGLVYRAALLAQAEVRYTNRQYNLDYGRKTSAIVEDPGMGLTKWENFAGPEIPSQNLQSSPQPNSQFRLIPGFLSQEKRVADMQKDFVEWLFRTGTIKLKSNQALKVTVGPEVSDADFQKQIAEAINTQKQADLDKVNQKYDTKIQALQRKIDSQEMDVQNAQRKVSNRTMETVATGGAAILGMLTGRKRSLSSSVTKVRMASEAKDQLNEEKQSLEQLKEQLVEMQKNLASELDAVNARWSTSAGQVTEIPLAPTKSNIFMDVFGVVWLPYYAVSSGGKSIEIPAFKRT
jgi:hypothetical protein